MLKKLVGINTLDYYAHLQVMKKQCVVNMSPGACAIKLFTTVIYGFS
jgi:hypothetical protein